MGPQTRNSILSSIPWSDKNHIQQTIPLHFHGQAASHGTTADANQRFESGGRRASFALLAIAAIVFAASRYYIFAMLEPQLSDVQTIYFNKAGSVVDLHWKPYQDGFLIEYPPLAWWTIYATRLVDDRRIINKDDGAQVVPVYESYRARFRGLMFFCDVGGFVIFIVTVWRRRPRWIGWAALVYAISTALLGHMLYDRLDAGLLLLLMIWALCWTRSCGSSDSEPSRDGNLSWMIAAYAAIGLSISYKLIPIICVPFLLLSELYTAHVGRG